MPTAGIELAVEYSVLQLPARTPPHLGDQPSIFVGNKMVTGAGYQPRSSAARVKVESAPLVTKAVSGRIAAPVGLCPADIRWRRTRQSLSSPAYAGSVGSTGRRHKIKSAAPPASGAKERSLHVMVLPAGPRVTDPRPP